MLSNVHLLFLRTSARSASLAGTFEWAAMVSHVTTVAFQGIEAVPVDVQVHISSGQVYFGIVGLPDKAVNESRDRVSAALYARTGGSSSISPPPTSRRKAATTTCRSRSP